MRVLAACTCPGYWLTVAMMVALALATLALIAMVVMIVWFQMHDDERDPEGKDSSS